MQMAVIQHLQLTGVPGLLFFRIPNDAKRSVVSGAWEKRMGLRPGVADLCIVVNGRVHFLELKAGGKRLSEEQKAFCDGCYAAGATYYMADTLDRALIALHTWGAIRTRPQQRHTESRAEARA